jgi:hypothetical protein
MDYSQLYRNIVENDHSCVGLDSEIDKIPSFLMKKRILF